MSLSQVVKLKRKQILVSKGISYKYQRLSSGSSLKYQQISFLDYYHIPAPYYSAYFKLTEYLVYSKCSPSKITRIHSNLHRTSLPVVSTKQIKEFFSRLRLNYNVAKRFSAAFNSGSRIFPSQTNKNDADYQLRLDAGELIDNRYQNIVLQVNSQATNTGLRAWLKRQPRGTHAKLAVARFDTLAEDPDAESERVLTELQDQARVNL